MNQSVMNQPVVRHPLLSDRAAPRGITVEAVAELFARHVRLYTVKPPTYQTELLASLAEVWVGHHRNVLDVGGGTGLMAEAIATFLPVGNVTAVDVVDRFLPGLSVSAQAYDGRTLPFADGVFDAATINNVIHHVPKGERLALLKEIRRVVAGPLYIKDHLTNGAVDDIRLATLDIIGNVPFGGMTQARYLPRAEWEQLAAAAGYVISAERSGRYRRGVQAAVFPNRLEVTFRLDPVGAA